MILIKLSLHVNEKIVVAVKKFQNFWWSRFLIIRQNVNMATNAILYVGLPPITSQFQDIDWQHQVPRHRWLFLLRKKASLD